MGFLLSLQAVAVGVLLAISVLVLVFLKKRLILELVTLL